MPAAARCRRSAGPTAACGRRFAPGVFGSRSSSRSRTNTPLPNLIQGQGPTRADEEALVYGAWRYLLQMAVEFRDAEILAAQGGTDGVRRSYEDALRRVDRLAKAVPAAPMEIRHHVSRCVANVPYSELRGAGS